MNNETNNNKTLTWVIVVVVAFVLLWATCLCSCLAGTLIGSRVAYSNHRSMDYPRYEEPDMWREWPEEPAPPEPFQEEEFPWLGVYFSMVDEGALVAEVVADSPAERAGIEIGDIITEVEGEPVTVYNPLDAHILRYEPGERIELILLRNGRERSITVRLDVRPLMPQMEQQPWWYEEEERIPPIPPSE